MSLEQNRGIVLVVEDMPGSRWLVEHLLQEAGFETRSAENGAEAIAFLRSAAPPVAIVLDLSMPVMDGWEFLNFRRTSFELSAIPVILYSADPSIAEGQLEKNNVVALVPKEETDTKLLTTVEDVVAHRKTG